MLLNTTKENVCVNQIIGQKLENIVLEGDMIVPDIKPDILSCVSSNGNVCIYKKEALDGKVRLDGSINLYIVYLADTEQEEIRGLNTTLDFSNIIDFSNMKPGFTIDEDIRIKDIECRVLNGRKIGIKVILEANIKAYSNETIEVISQIDGVEDLQLLEHYIELNSLIGEGTTKVYAKDTFVIDSTDELVEILKVDIKLLNKDTKVSYNKVLVKADAEFKILYLTESGQIKTLVNIIPVMGFIDMPNITEEHICNTKYKLRNLLVKVNNSQEHSIYVEAELELYCFAYEKKNVRIIQDLYSPKNVLTFNRKQIQTRSYKDNIKDVYQLKERMALDINPGDIILDFNLRSEILSNKIANGTIYYEVENYLDYLYQKENSRKLESKRINLPFNYSVELPSDEITLVETSIQPHEATVVILPDGSVEVKANLDFELETFRNEEINLIEEIDNLEECPKTYSVIIYYTKKGDTLWNIAKRFNSTVDEIVEFNDIENPDKVDVGMPLFIPKYVLKQNG